MHHIISSFVLQQNQAGIFVDVARFSTVTSASMEHGQQGAKAMAVIMSEIFESTVKAAYD